MENTSNWQTKTINDIVW